MAKRTTISVDSLGNCHPLDSNVSFRKVDDGSIVDIDRKSCTIYTILNGCLGKSIKIKKKCDQGMSDVISTAKAIAQQASAEVCKKSSINRKISYLVR